MTPREFVTTAVNFDDYFWEGFLPKKDPKFKLYKVPSRELYKVVFTEDKVREKGGRVCLSLLCLLLFLLKGWAANKTN